MKITIEIRLLCVHALLLILVTYTESLPTSLPTICSCSPWQFCRNDSACVDCSRCDGGGEGAIELCSNYTDTRCGKCEAGKTYSVLSVSENVYRCQPCTVCEPDRDTLSECTSESNTNCGACPPGMFAYINDTCLTCSPCPDDTSVIRFTECRFNGAPKGFMCAPGACPGCSDSPTIPTVNYSNEGGFLPVYTDKLVVMGPTKDLNTAAVAGVAITVAVIAGVLTIVVCFFSVWLIYTLYVKHYIQSRRQRGLRTSICRQSNEETTALMLAEEAPDHTNAGGEMAMVRTPYSANTVCRAEPSLKLLYVIGLVAEVTDKWKLVARSLQIRSDLIDEIERSHSGTKKCCEVMLDKWLKKSADPSWNCIIEACDKNELHSIAKKMQIFFGGNEAFFDSDVASWDYLVGQIKRVYVAWPVMPKWCSQFSDALLPLNVKAKNCMLSLEDAIYKLTEEKEFSQIVVLVGLAGSGKTTMVRQLLHNWARSGSSSHYTFVIYANMFVDKNKVTNFQSLIGLHLEKSHMMERMEEILIKQKGEGVLIIIDEYDEACCNSAQNLLINPSLMQKLLPKCTILLVCRPATIPKTLCEIELIEIPALKNDQVNHFLQETVGPAYTASIDNSPARPLMHNPLQLNILCYLIKRDIDVTGISVMTELYDIFVLKVLSNQVRNYKVEKDENHSAIVRSLLKLMAKASYVALCHNMQALSDLSEVTLSDLSVDIIIESGLVERRNTGTLYFVHLTIQGFLAARHIAHSQSPPESLLENLSCKSFLLPFLSGITGKLFFTLIQNSLAVAAISYTEAKWTQSKHIAEEPLLLCDVLILDMLTLTPHCLQCIKTFLKGVKVFEIDISGYDDVWLNSFHARLPKHSEIISSVMSCNSLTTLSAEHINISPVFWIDLANMLKSNQSLLKLNVSHNDISDYKIVHVISEALTFNTSLKTLVLKCCRLVGSHAECIIKSLLCNKTLQHLDLSYNLIKELNINIVKEILQLGVIKVIGLDGNPIERAVYSDLIKVANLVQRDRSLFLFHNFSICNTLTSYETFV